MFELAPGPRKKIWVNYSVFIWQGVNETKKVKNPCDKAIYSEFILIPGVSIIIISRQNYDSELIVLEITLL